MQPLLVNQASSMRRVWEVIEFLIEHGADINAKNTEGHTPGDQMLQHGREDLAEVMRRHGGNPS